MQGGGREEEEVLGGIFVAARDRVVVSWRVNALIRPPVVLSSAQHNTYQLWCL
jgi:hypothetical protein